MTVRENLDIGAYILGKDRARIEQALRTRRRFLSGHRTRMRQLAGTMSGGEQQMLAIARALMASPTAIPRRAVALGLSPKFGGQ